MALAIRYRPADRSFSLRRPDGGVLRLLPRRLILEAAPGGTLAGLRRLARSLADHLGWIAVAEGWSSPQHVGAMLATPPVESRRAWADVLARARWVGGGSRPAWLDVVSTRPAISRNEATSAAGLFEGRAVAAGLMPPGPPVVVVTLADWAAIGRIPKRASEMLAAFARRHPGAEAAQVHDAHHLPTPVPLTRLIAAVRGLDAAVSPSMTHRNGFPRGWVDMFDAQTVGEPDRSTATLTEQEDPNDEAGSDAPLRSVLPDNQHGSIHEGSASLEGGRTVNPTPEGPTCDQQTSHKVEEQDEVDSSQEELLTNSRNQAQDADAPWTLDDQPSPF